MSNYTAGPWECVQLSHGTMLVRSKASGMNGYIAEIYSSRPSEWKANARLIEAAPDLLEALIELADWYKEYTGLPPTAANAAIAKATGEEP